MKKILIALFCACMLISTVSITAQAALMGLMSVSLTVPEPKAGEKPGEVKISGTFSEVTNVRWEGLDANGCFSQNSDYTVFINFGLTSGSAKKYEYKADNFKVTVNSNREAEILSQSGSTAYVKYTFKQSGGVDFAPDEYGTAVANKNLSIYSLANIGSSTGEKIPEGTAIKVLRAYVATTTALKCHMVEYNGKTVYLMLWNSDKADMLRDIKVEGKLDPDNIPANCVPNRGEVQEEKPIAISKINTSGFTATRGKTPELKISGSTYIAESIKYSSDPVKEAYAWVTATVTYKPKSEKYYFTDDIIADNRTLSLNALGYSAEILSKSKDTVVVKYTTLSDNGESRSDITQEMRDFHDYMSNNSITRIPTKAMGKLYDPAGNAMLYQHPLLLSGENEPPKTFYIHDIQHHVADLSEKWYYVSDLRAIHGFIPAAYVTDITECEYFEGAPGTNKRTPFKFAGGIGTVDDPYLVETADQLNSIRYKPTLHYKLVADIDLSKWGNWTPIGGTPAYGGYPGDSVNKAQQSGAFFTGSLDGDGHTIYGMQIVINEDKPYMYEGGNLRYYGLFAIITEGEGHNKPTISNLNLVDYKIDVRYNNAIDSVGGDQYWLGSFAADCLAAKIENCHAYGGSIKLHFGKTDGTVTVGGITGECSDATLTRCSNSSDITVSVGDETLYKYSFQAGGITGKLTDSNNITECYNSGDVTLPLTGSALEFHWTNSYAGGISSETAPVLDSANTSYITNCYNSGNITARAVNDIVVYNGTSTKLYVKNFYNVGKLTYNPAEEGAGPELRNKLIPTTYKTNCSANGNAVSGDEWRYSEKLGRMVLKAFPEDSQPKTNYSFVTPIVGKFVDVKADAWYAESVKWAVDKKITVGTTETTFSPDNTCTKAQIITFIYRAVGSPKASAKNPFSDVKESDYYYDSARWAYEKGMVSGGKFDPNSPCRRSDTVKYLWINAGSPKASYSGNFDDVKTSADYALAVAWAVDNSITSGTSKTTFSPDMTCTRGQIVTFLLRALKQ